MKCGVLGDPVAHSLSPVLHRAAYDELGLSDWTYDAVRVPAGSLGAFLGGLSGEWRGLSLTMPLKREAMALLASVSHRGRLVGAVNTLVRTSYGWAGDNTDLPGAVTAVRERFDGPVTAGAILGAGATAASTGLALAELGAGRISLLARDPARAEETLEVIRRHRSAPHVVVLPLDATPPADIVVSTLPTDAQTPGLVARWRDAPVLFDVVYDPWPTPLVAAASGAIVSGLDLLVHQAVAQFELFTGQPAPLAAMRAAGERALGITAPDAGAPA